MPLPETRVVRSHSLRSVGKLYEVFQQDLVAAFQSIPMPPGQVLHLLRQIVPVECGGAALPKSTGLFERPGIRVPSYSFWCCAFDGAGEMLSAMLLPVHRPCLRPLKFRRKR